jgi:hypothetical protein
MKTVLGILLLAIATAGAQTNNLPAFISFTNSSGDFITNAEVVRVLPNKLIWKDSGGNGGIVRLDALPADLRQQFNYDPTEANEADQAEEIIKAKNLEFQREQAELLKQK